jgi:hypothetical protein
MHSHPCMNWSLASRDAAEASRLLQLNAMPHLLPAGGLSALIPRLDLWIRRPFSRWRRSSLVQKNAALATARSNWLGAPIDQRSACPGDGCTWGRSVLPPALAGPRLQWQRAKLRVMMLTSARRLRSLRQPGCALLKLWSCEGMPCAAVATAVRRFFAFIVRPWILLHAFPPPPTQGRAGGKDIQHIPAIDRIHCHPTRPSNTNQRR